MLNRLTGVTPGVAQVAGDSTDMCDFGASGWLAVRRREPIPDCYSHICAAALILVVQMAARVRHLIADPASTSCLKA